MLRIGNSTTLGKWSGEITNRNKGGSIYEEWLRITAIKNKRGEIINYIGIFSDITAKKESERQLHQHAHHDALTGLPNRLSFDQRLEQEMQRAKRTNKKAAVLYIDLDNFKPINDSYGHLVGDVVLCEISNRIKAELREIDCLARLGGDEFAVILPEITNTDIIDTIINRIKIAMQKPVQISENQHTIGASIGTAVYPDDAKDAMGLVALADKAMYKSKNLSRSNKVSFLHPDK